jgi:DNA processing protein
LKDVSGNLNYHNIPTIETIANMLPNHENEELFYRIALTFVDGIGSKTARQLLEHFGNATDIFRASLKELKHTEGVGEIKARNFKLPEILSHAEKELGFIQKNGVKTLLINKNYPTRLSTCSDAPTILYYKGEAELDKKRVVAIVGTRKNTDYGCRICEELVEGLRDLEDIIVISGLALGIDAIAHKKCIQAGIPTVGVLGHGLDRIYPATHNALARQMVANGGILTEFASGTLPEKSNFPMRNRVVAGLSDVTVVVESSSTGGALITARMASGYNREVAAYPGRITDARSAGCNELIRTNVAAMITKARELVELMNWDATSRKKPVQRQLFINLSPEEEKIYQILQAKEQLHTDELQFETGLPVSMLAATLLQMEMQGLIKTLPGKNYRLI